MYLRKVFFLIVVCFSIFILFFGKYKSPGRRLLHKEEILDKGYSPGELFYMCKVDYFKDKIPYKKRIEKDSIENALVLTYGDSYFYSPFGNGIFADLLEDSLNTPVYNIRPDGMQVPYNNPYTYLKNTGYKRGERKFLIFETVDRTAANRAKKYIEACNDTLPVQKKNLKQRIKQFRNSIFYNQVCNTLFSGNDLEYFFSENKFVFPIANFFSNLKFKLTREIDSRLEYSLNPKMLFYFENVTSSKTQHNENEIQEMVDNISFLSRKLNDDFNVMLIYLVIPNSYTIYHDYIDSMFQYDNFIPRLQNRLSTQNIEYIDLYSAFLRHRKNENSVPLFPISDTHLSMYGKTILTNLAAKKVEQLCIKDTILINNLGIN